MEDLEFATKLRNLIGYVENATDTSVKIYQDDATKDFIVMVGKRQYFSRNFHTAFENAFKDPLNDPFK